MHERKARPKPFQNSLSALAQVALRETDADGYAFFRTDPETSALVRLDAGGATITGENIARGTDAGSGTSIITYAIGQESGVAFSFHSGQRAAEARPQLDRIAAAIEAVWSAAEKAGRYSQLASQVADLETRLMDSKIADRVRGFLSHRGESSPVEAIVRHVEGILRPAPSGRVLEQLSQELEEEVEERRLTNRAKAILQSVHGMSEEQAHAHLRQASRRSRRKLKDVAVALIEEHPAGSKAGRSEHSC